MCRTLESTLSSEELFLEQASRENTLEWIKHIKESSDGTRSKLGGQFSSSAAIFFSLRQYAGVLDKFCAKTISINNFSSKRVDSKGLYGR